MILKSVYNDYTLKRQNCQRSLSNTPFFVSKTPFLAKVEACQNFFAKFFEEFSKKGLTSHNKSDIIYRLKGNHMWAARTPEWRNW